MNSQGKLFAAAESEVGALRAAPPPLSDELWLMYCEVLARYLQDRPQSGCWQPHQSLWSPDTQLA